MTPPSPPPPQRPPVPPSPKPAPEPKEAPKVDPVAELLALVESPDFDPNKVTGEKLLPEQAIFILRTFLIATQELEERGLSTSSAILLVAHTGVETSFAKPGTKNPNPKAGNVFPYQPKQASEAALKRRGIEVDWLPRVNRINGELVTRLTPTPQFSKKVDGLRLAIETQLCSVNGCETSITAK